MADRCSVRGCSTVLRPEKESSLKLYRFPRDTNLKDKWKLVLKLDKVHLRDRVCSLHFRDSDFTQTNLGWKVLTPFAVPSRTRIMDFPPSNTHLEENGDSVCKGNQTNKPSVSIRQDTEILHDFPILVKEDSVKIFEALLVKETEIVSDLRQNVKEEPPIFIHNTSKGSESGELLSSGGLPNTTVPGEPQMKVDDLVKQTTFSADNRTQNSLGCVEVQAGNWCCCVRGCSTVLAAGKENTLKLYRFPRDKNLNSKWKEVLKLDEVNPSDRVCSLHFLDSDYIQTNLGWKILASFAVPSRNIYLPLSNSYLERHGESESNKNHTEKPVSVKHETETLHDIPIQVNEVEGFEISFPKDSAGTVSVPSPKRQADTAVFWPLAKRSASCHRKKKTHAENRYCTTSKEEFSNSTLLLKHKSFDFSLKSKHVSKSLKSSVADELRCSFEKNFVCTLCDHTFSLRSDLSVHHKAQHFSSSSPSKCLSCNINVKTTGDLKIHVITTHLKNKFICTKCHRLFKTLAEMWTHSYDLDHGLYLQCPECCELFPSISKLIDHFKSHPCVSFYCCEFCHLIFTSAECVEIHVSNHISNGAKVVKCAFCMNGNSCHQSLHFRYHTHNYVSSTLPNHDFGKKPQAGFQAPCVETFPASSAASSADLFSMYEECCLPSNKNMYSVVKVGPEALTAVFSSSSSALDSPEIDSDIELKCEDCNEVFRNENERSLHLKLHQARRDFCCIDCGVQCNSFKELNSHYEDHVKAAGRDGHWSSSEEDE
ncbi:Zinc finger protein 354A [Frankliniella fusca]|uniref:Zinc finger protein 354A n=1 Tax=Frankliniella fusca TaxID=407009 RepID=A0AAE1LBN9_9NEOP|nr:Zinc finger protein 354A [Frankliniella fusca]